MTKEEVSVYHSSQILKRFPVWFYLPVFVAVLFACAAGVIFKLYSKDDTENMRRDNFIDKIGHSVNCGPPENQMHFSWSPKILHKTTNPLSVTLDMLATVDLHSGNVQLNVTTKEKPDTPISQKNPSGGCHKLKKLGFQNLNCPVKTNDQIKTNLKITDVTKLPEGEFILMIVITNEKNEIFLCLKADVTIQG